MRNSQVPSIYSLGLDFEEVRLVPYSVLWPGIFQAEKRRIEISLYGFDVIVDHVGSTSVPGCSAKPVMDMVARYKRDAERSKIIAGIVNLGYLYLGQCGREGRDFFVLNRGRQTLFHMHLTSARHRFPLDLLRFRDRLRNSAEEVDQYVRFKSQLAERYPMDRNGYRIQKGHFFIGNAGLHGRYTRRVAK